MIRRAELRDIPELMRLLKQVNNVHAEGRPDLFRMDCTKYTPEELADILKQPDNPVFVRTEEENSGGTEGCPALGYAFCKILASHGNNLMPRKEVYIDDICVDASRRGQGVGESLYRYIADWARKSGDFYRITLNVWSLNPGAMKFYEAMGMRPFRVSMEEILK